MSDVKKVQEVTIEGNEAAAYVAYNLSEVIAIYPITPSSNMGEYSDAWSAKGVKNVWGTVPNVTEMQSEGGAAGAVHGALQAGALSTTFTASQGLLLMIPNMYKIAGELTPTVFHVSARSLAAQALSIFGDHSDVMSCRQTGFAMLASNSVQEVMDLALVAHRATLESRIPFLHFFDGFRTSHEVQKIKKIPEADIKNFIDDKYVTAFRKLALTPDAPVVRGTAQNPDVYFQGRETVNKFYNAVPAIVENAMKDVQKITGRAYKLFDYVGHPEAEKVIVLMGSGADAAEELIAYAKNEKIGIVKVRLYRPFSNAHLIGAFPKTVKKIAVLDRTKEPGSNGEPLYLDVVAALSEANTNGTLPFAMPKIVGGRYGLSSKEFTPAMVKGVFDELAKDAPKNSFTIGINDDVTHTSLAYDADFSAEEDSTFRGMFFGLGSDGTVSANKNSIKIIGELTENNAQGYFVYDSKKAGTLTTSHLRFGKNPIKSSYLINKANFIACHQFSFLEKYDILAAAENGAVFLLNSIYSKDEVWDKMPQEVQAKIIEKKLKFYVIDGYKVANDVGLGVRINTIMQTCFFKISNILPEEEAIRYIKSYIEKAFGKKGQDILDKNYAAVDNALAHLQEVKYPANVTSKIARPALVPADAPQFVKEVTAEILAGRGNDIPVSKMPVDGTFPTSTTKWEKRNIALEIPVWNCDECIQCGKCSLICPHGVIRMKAYPESHLKDAPKTFKAVAPKGKEFPEGYMFTLQVSPEDCTGCGLCVQTCPVKSKKEEGKKAINMSLQEPLRFDERDNWNFFLNLPNPDRAALKTGTVKGSQFLEPLFEFSGACAGCGETSYVKLISQLFGDRMVVANATGCSSIYGGNLPTTPYTQNAEGKGPAWSNSLFEDNAEFGLGFRLSIDKKIVQATEYLHALKSELGEQLVNDLTNSDQKEEADIAAQRARVAELKNKLQGIKKEEAHHLGELADYLVKKSVWIFGGDGWAYDIGYGGLDHSLALGKNINVLVMDTGVYSNTGGQNSKATPLGAIAKFAAAGQDKPKKDLGVMTMIYGNVYVAQISLGANDAQALKAIKEAEAYEGPSLIIAYSHCIAHGFELNQGVEHQKMAVNSGIWPLYRYNPELAKEGKNPLQIDSKEASLDLGEYLYSENRFKQLLKMNPERAEAIRKQAEVEIKRKWNLLQGMAKIEY